MLNMHWDVLIWYLSLIKPKPLPTESYSTILLSLHFCLVSATSISVLAYLWCAVAITFKKFKIPNAFRKLKQNCFLSKKKSNFGEWLNAKCIWFIIKFMWFMFTLKRSSVYYTTQGKQKFCHGISIHTYFFSHYALTRINVIGVHCSMFSMSNRTLWFVFLFIWA